MLNTDNPLRVELPEDLMDEGLSPRRKWAIG
jgi:hypothetical protein